MAQPRHGEMFVAVPYALTTFLLSIYTLGPKLLLICLFGWHRVAAEHLFIAQRLKGHPWIVSDGEMLSSVQSDYADLLAAICWLALFWAPYLLLRLLLPVARKPVA